MGIGTMGLHTISVIYEYYSYQESNEMDIPKYLKEIDHAQATVYEKIMRRGNMKIVIIFLTSLLLVVSSCTTTNPTTLPVHPITQTTTATNSSTGSTIPILLVTDSFTMVPFTNENETKLESENANISEVNQLTLPYNKYGWYCSNLFFVNAGETVEITINSDYPISVANHEIQNVPGLVFFPDKPQYTGLDSSDHYANWLKSYGLDRTNNGFTTSLIYSVDEAGICYIRIINQSIGNSKCQYTINILK